MPSEAHRDRDGIEEGARRGVERKCIVSICKKIKKCGAYVVLLHKSIPRDAYNEPSLHFVAKMEILVVTDAERTDVEFVCRTLGCTPVPHRTSIP